MSSAFFNIFACSSIYPNKLTAIVPSTNYSGDLVLITPPTEITISVQGVGFNVQIKFSEVFTITFFVDENTKAQDFPDPTRTLFITVLDESLPSEICNQPVESPSIQLMVSVGRTNLPNLFYKDTFFITTGRRKSDSQQISSVNMMRRKSPEFIFSS